MSFYLHFINKDFVEKKDKEKKEKKKNVRNYWQRNFPDGFNNWPRFTFLIINGKTITIGLRTHPSIRGTSVRILLITSSLCWCVTGTDCNRSGKHKPPRSNAAIRRRIGVKTRHLLRGLSSIRSLLLPLLGESSHGGGSRTVPLHGATSGSCVRHVVWNKIRNGRARQILQISLTVVVKEILKTFQILQTHFLN